MLKILLILFALCFGDERQFYFGQDQSLIDWEKNNPVHFLNFGKWKLELQYKEKNPNWEILMKDRKLREPLGRSLECVGNCKLYRGRASNKIQFKSLLQEGDEVVTEKESYLWLFLLDGTMVRLSPKSSISLREINIGVDANFFHVRVNYGNVLWLSRDMRNFRVENAPDSDTLFTPLSFKEANPEIEKKEYQENNLYSLLEKTKVWENHGKYLNRLVDENNLYIQGKPTYSFLILPNVTLTGLNLSVEVIVLDGGNSFFKKRGPEQLNLEVDDSGLKIDRVMEAYLRNTEESKGITADPNIWYQVTEDGEDLEKVDDKEALKFWPSEMLTRRISSIYVARELLFRIYSVFMFEDIRDPQLFAKNYGYRLWDRLEPIYNKDLSKRVEFLKDYTRREEKIIYNLKKKFYEVGKEEDRREFFLKALNHNYMKRELNEDEFEKILLDSSK